MMKIIESVSLIALFGLIFCATDVVAAPYQELEPRKGHVPVYIRVGDTPLSEIHPTLAEAFNESFESGDLKLENSSKTDESKTDVTLSLDKKTETVVDKSNSTADRKEVEIPATVVKDVKKDTESDIASFDVVKRTSDDEKVEAKKQK